MRLPSFRLNAAWIFAAVLLIRLVVLARFGHSEYLFPTGGDMKFYADWGAARATGWHGTHAYYALPGYALALSYLFRFTGVSPLTVATLQAFSEAGIAALIFSLTCWTFPGRRAKTAGVIAALGWAFFQPAQAFSLVTMPTTWGVLAFWSVYAWSVRTESRSPWWPWAGIGLLSGLAATMVATALLLLPLTLVAAWRNLRKPVLVAAALAAMLAGVAVGTSPCWYHNWVEMKDPVLFSGHTGLNFWIGNNPGANGYPKIPPGLRATQAGMLKDSILTPEAEAGHELKRAEISRYWSSKAHAYIRENPGAWLRLLALKVRNFWNNTQYDDLSLITPLTENGVLLPGPRFGTVMVAGLAGLALAWRRFPRARWTAGAVLLLMAGLLPMFITERYRLPAVPGFLILGGGGLVAVYEALAALDWRHAGAWLGTGAVALAVAHLPQADEDVSGWLDDFNAGRQELEIGRLDQAYTKLQRAATAVPDNADVLTALGTYWLKTRSFSNARDCYTKALASDPKMVTAINNLAILEMRDHHWVKAQRLLERGLAIEPESAEMKQLAVYCAAQLQKESAVDAPAF